MDALAIRQWLAALDAVSYYGLFQVEPTANYDELRAAFHKFAEAFHPENRDHEEEQDRRYVENVGVFLPDPVRHHRADQHHAEAEPHPHELSRE